MGIEDILSGQSRNTFMTLKSSTVVKSVLIGTPVFLSGCGCSVVSPPVVTPVTASDGTPVVTVYQPGYHYSPFYHGFVPIFVPIGGLGYGNSYTTIYNRQPESDRRRYATPTSSGGSAGRVATPVTGGGGTATPVTSTSPSASTSTAKPATSASTTTRGIAGGIGMGTHLSGGSAS